MKRQWSNSFIYEQGTLKGLGVPAGVPVVPQPAPLAPAGGARNFHQLLSGSSNIYSDVAGGASMLDSTATPVPGGSLDSMLGDVLGTPSATSSSAAPQYHRNVFDIPRNELIDKIDNISKYVSTAAATTSATARQRQDADNEGMLVT